MPRAILLFFTALIIVGQASAADPVGFRYLQIPASPQGRALEAVVWYPATKGETPTLVGDNPVLTGLPVQVDAPAAAGQRALVVLSHGYGGNWSNQGSGVAGVGVRSCINTFNHASPASRYGLLLKNGLAICCILQCKA